MQRRNALPHRSSSKGHPGIFLFPGFTLAMAILALTLFLSPRLSAQAANSVVTGRVTDASGAVLTNTNVTLTQTDTGLVLHTVTNNEGIYSFPSLQTGP